MLLRTQGHLAHMLFKLGKSFSSQVVSIIHFNDFSRPLDPNLIGLINTSELFDHFLHSTILKISSPTTLTPVKVMQMQDLVHKEPSLCPNESLSVIPLHHDIVHRGGCGRRPTGPCFGVAFSFLCVTRPSGSCPVASNFGTSSSGTSMVDVAALEAGNPGRPPSACASGAPGCS